jgi:hypothetical protein
MRKEAMEVPVRPLPALQLTITMWFTFSTQQQKITVRHNAHHDGKWLTFEEVKHLLTNFEENIHRRRVVILPLVL